MKTRRGFLAAAGGLFSGLTLPSAAQAWGLRRRQVVCPQPVLMPPVCRPLDQPCQICLLPQYCYGQFGTLYYYDCCYCPNCNYYADGCSDQPLVPPPGGCTDCGTCDPIDSSCICAGDNTMTFFRNTTKKDDNDLGFRPAVHLAKKGTRVPIRLDSKPWANDGTRGVPPLLNGVTVTVNSNQPPRKVDYTAPNHVPLSAMITEFMIVDGNNPIRSRTVRIGIQLPPGTPQGGNGSVSGGTATQGHGQRHHIVTVQGETVPYDIIAVK